MRLKDEEPKSRRELAAFSGQGTACRGRKDQKTAELKARQVAEATNRPRAGGSWQLAVCRWQREEDADGRGQEPGDRGQRAESGLRH